MTLSNRTLKIQANLLFKSQMIDYHEFDVIPTLEKTKIIKHKFYLFYSCSVEMLEHKKWRYFNRSDIINDHPYPVHFHIFVLEKNNSVEEIGAWYYPIYFDYLPAFRLAVVLKFPFWFANRTFHSCWQQNCTENSVCLAVFNEKNSFYCSCKSGYYGSNCSMYEPLCETYCLKNAHCRSDDIHLTTGKKKVHCICPLGRFGARCNLKYDVCESNPCLNNGTCLPTYDRSGENAYVCICSERFYDFRCQREKASVNISLNMTKTLSVRATIVQFYTYDPRSMMFLIEHQQTDYGLPSLIRYFHSRPYAPDVALRKIYEDLSIPRYFLMYFRLQLTINMISSLEYCPYASLLLSEGQSLHVE